VIKIKPTIDGKIECPNCCASLVPREIIWQGVHVCAAGTCSECTHYIIADLPIAHAIRNGCRFDTTDKKLYIQKESSRKWFGAPLQKSLQNPDSKTFPELKVTKLSSHRQVIILNCIDYLYGHAILKLFNAEYHLRSNQNYGLILLIPSFLRWLVPEGVAEIWTVDIPLQKAQNYYPSLNVSISAELVRFESVFLSRAVTHPRVKDISFYTGVNKCLYDDHNFRVTFIWREDRTWSQDFSAKLWLGQGWSKIPELFLQNLKVRMLFTVMKKVLPHVHFTVVGLGTFSTFPSWIEDRRVVNYDEHCERAACKIYSESKLVIGVHGSGMLLPSAHAGLTLDLMPLTRWGNISQDILYQEEDPLMASYRYRYLPSNVSVQLLAKIAIEQIMGYRSFEDVMIKMSSRIV
jgi:hypothetical protein